MGIKRLIFRAPLLRFWPLELSNDFSSFLGCVKNTLTLENTKVQGTSESKAIHTNM